MKLPNGERALVDLAKVTDYLLNASHPDNGGKAQFFVDAGFTQDDPIAVVEALRRVAVSGEVMAHVESSHGLKFVIDGMLHTPGGHQRSVRTVWIVDAGETVPRLVTAYPGGSKQ